MLLWFLVRERERRHRTTDCDMLSCVCCCFFTCNILFTCLFTYPNFIQILCNICENHIQIIERTHFGGNLFGPLSNSQRYHFVADQATKPLLQRFAHLAPWEAESIQEIAEEFQYLWLHWMCRNNGMCVCFNVQTYIYILERKWPGYVDWILYLVSGGWKRLQNKRTFTGSSFFSQDSLFHASLSAFYKGTVESPGWRFPGFLEFSTFENGMKIPTLGPRVSLVRVVAIIAIIGYHVHCL